MPHPTPTTLRSRTPLSAALLASVGETPSAALSPGSIRPDFEVFTTPMATYGVLDPLTKAVTPLADLGLTKYPHEQDLTAFLLKMRAGGKGMSDGDIADLQSLPRPVVRMTGSSSEQDLEGDVMSREALDDMTKCRDNLTIFRDHSYSLPTDLYGTMVGLPWLQIQDGVTDLWLQCDVEVLNVLSLETYLYTLRGRSIGVSGGFMVQEAKWIDRKTGKVIANQEAVSFEDVLEGTVALLIVHTKAVEWSTVGIPANQRSWVGGAAKGLFRRTGHPLLAPIARGYAPDGRDWLKLLREAEVTPEQRRDLEDLPPRRSIAPSGAVLYSFPDETGWSYRAKAGKSWRELARSEVAVLLTRSAAAAASLPDFGTHSELAEHDDDHAGNHAGNHTADHADDAAPDLVKGATGKADWPLAERDRAWDAGAAHQRVAAWAGYEPGGDGFSIAKMKSAHFWSPQGDDAKDISKYKLLFIDIVDGKPMAIPRAIFACTGAHGVDAAAIPADDQDAIKTKIERQYARMRAAFDDDSLYPSWQQPGGRAGGSDDGKSVTEAHVTTKAKGPKIAADGSHEAFTGTHSHAHPAFGDQGEDEMHTHTHTHDGDADHDHAHAEETKAGEKAAEPEVVKTLTGDTDTASTFSASSTQQVTSEGAEGATGEMTIKAASQPIAVIQEGMPSACKNCEKAVPEGHASMKCAACGHCLNCAAGPIPESARKCMTCGVKMRLASSDDEEGDEKTGEPDLTKATNTETASHVATAVTKTAPLDADTNVTVLQRQALLASYNSLGTLLGLPTVALDGTREGTPDLAKSAPWAATPESAQQVITLVSDIDSMVDFLCQANIYGIDAKVDQLMHLLGIPDIDGVVAVNEEGTINDPNYDPNTMPATMPATMPGQSYPYYASSAARPHLHKALHKAGARNSGRDFSDMQTIHDAIVRLTDGSVCASVNTQAQGDHTPPQGGAGNSEADARAADDGAEGTIRADTHRGKDFAPNAVAPAEMTEVAKALTVFAVSVKGFDLPILAKQVETMRETAERAAGAFLDLDKQQKALAQEQTNVRLQQAALVKNAGELHDQQTWLATQIGALGNMPLGRPTALNRTLDLTDPTVREAVATYDDLLRVNADNALAAKGITAGASDLSLEAALALTTLKTVDGTEYRCWPKGLIPAGGRPEPSNWAKITMSWAEMSAYRAGEEALVPTRDEHVTEATSLAS